MLIWQKTLWLNRKRADSSFLQYSWDVPTKLLIANETRLDQSHVIFIAEISKNIMVTVRIAPFCTQDFLVLMISYLVGNLHENYPVFTVFM